MALSVALVGCAGLVGRFSKDGMTGCHTHSLEQPMLLICCEPLSAILPIDAAGTGKTSLAQSASAEDVQLQAAREREIQSDNLRCFP
jgi:hypothetical protein